jgi:List-Bact-rpt repeat protein
MLRTALAAICLTLTVWTVSGAVAQPDAGRPALSVSVAGSGKILSNDGRIDCGSRCSASYRKGSIRKLTASPSEGFEFVKWEGDCIGTAPICEVALDRSQSATASFVGKPMLILVSVGGPGRVSSAEPAFTCGGTNGFDCGGLVPYGTMVTLTPEAEAGGQFAGWDGPCAAAGTSPCTLSVNGPVETAAAFGHLTPIPGKQPLTVDVGWNAHVTSQPFGIDCLPTCSAQFLSPTLVTLTRDAQSQWGGGCRGGLTRCRLVVDSPTEVAATTPPPPPLAPAMPPPPPVTALLDATVSGKGLVTGSHLQCGRAPNPRRRCSDYILSGGLYTLHAARRQRTYFARWGGDCRGKKPTCRITVPSGASPTYEVTGLFRVKG